VSLLRAVWDRSETREEVRNKTSMEVYLGAIRRLGRSVVMPGSQIKQDEKIDAGAFVLMGEYGGMKASADRSFVVFSPGSTVTKQVEVTGKLVLNGANLKCEGDSPAVVVKSGGYLIARGCHISKDDNEQSALSTYILIEDGGFAMIEGCMFHGVQSGVGSLVRNDNAAVPPGPGRVAVAGCVNASDVTTTPFVNMSYAQYVPS